MSSTTAPPMPRWRVWFLATRPWSLTISVIPIMLASVLAWQDGSVSILYGLLMLLTSVFTHIGCNLTNDYFDNQSGVDVVQMQGQGRMLQDGHLTDTDIRNGIIVAFALALLCGAPIIIYLGWLGVAFAIIGAGVAFLYTGGPWPLAYNRMGEVGVFTAMGLVMVGGAYYVHTGTISWPAMLIAINVGLYAAGILHGNNMRDIHVDRSHNKHTLANTFGWDWALREYAFFIFPPLVLTVGLVIANPGYWPLLVTLAILPDCLAAFRYIRDTGDGNLTGKAVGVSTKLHMRYGLFATMGLLLKGIIGS